MTNDKHVSGFDALLNTDLLLSEGYTVMIYREIRTGKLEAWASSIWWLHRDSKRLKLAFVLAPKRPSA